MQLQKYFKKQRISTTKFLTIKTASTFTNKKTFTQNPKKNTFLTIFQQLVFSTNNHTNIPVRFAQVWV